MDFIDLPDSMAKTRRLSESGDFVSMVVGCDALAGQRISDGEVLEMVDILAGRIAHMHCRCMVATVALDRLVVVGPIFHQDLIRAHGNVVAIGSSSIIVKIQVHRYDMSSRSYRRVQFCLITMVSLLEQGVPNKNVPKLEYQDDERLWVEQIANYKKNSTQLDEEEKKINAIEDLTSKSINTEFNTSRSSFSTINETQIVIRYTIVPTDLNMNSTVFGGRMLTLMQKAAIQCARMFVGHNRVSLHSIDKIFFKRHLLLSDTIDIISKVVYVFNQHIDVKIEVESRRIKTEYERFQSHVGYFTYYVHDEAFRPMDVDRGILLIDDDQTSLKAFLNGKVRRTWLQKTYDELSLLSQ